MIFCFVFYLAASLHIQLQSTDKGKYVTKQTIGNQILDFLVSFDTDMVMVVDSRSVLKQPKYEAELSDSFMSLSQSSEECWSNIQISSTVECAFEFRSSLNITFEGILSKEYLKLGTAQLKDIIFGRIINDPNMTVSGIFGLGPENLDHYYTESLISVISSVIFI